MTLGRNGLAYFVLAGLAVVFAVAAHKPGVQRKHVKQPVSVHSAARDTTSRTTAGGLIGLPEGMDGGASNQEPYSSAHDVRESSVDHGDTSYTSGDESDSRKRQKLGYTSAGTLENAAGASSTVTFSR